MKRKQRAPVYADPTRIDAIEKRLRGRRPDTDDEFVTHAPEDMDYLLACVKSLRGVIDDMRKEIAGMDVSKEDIDE